MPSNVIGNLYNDDGTFSLDNLNALAEKIDSSYTMLDLFKAVKKGTIDKKTSKDFGNTVVKFGKFTNKQGESQDLVWIPAYLSKTYDGAPILTLWLASTDANNDTVSDQEVSYFAEGTKGAGGWNNSQDTTPSSNNYSTSYIRSVALNNGSVYYNGYDNLSDAMTPTEVPGSQNSDNKFAMFTTGALAEYIVEPKNVDWQVTADRLKNDPKWEGNTSGHYTNSQPTTFFDETDKTPKTWWLDDKVWLPSVSEVYDEMPSSTTTTSFTADDGLWKTDITKRANSMWTWLRSGLPNIYRTTFGLRADGTCADYRVLHTGAVRPALHLNLSKVVESLGLAEPHVSELKHTAAQTATCTNKGNIEYWYCATCNKYYSDAEALTEIIDISTITTDIDPTNHKWVIGWTSGETTHWHACENGCSEKKDEANHNWGNENIIKEADCINPGTKELTCSDCVKTKTETISALGHTYGNAVWTWADDGKTASAKIVCANDSSHMITDSAEVTGKQTTAATCTVKGTTTYTATITLNGTQYTDSKSVQDISALGHTYGNAVWIWTDDGKTASAKIVCANDSSHIITDSADVTGKQTTAATCTEKGTTTYTAIITLNGKQYTDSKSVQDVEMLAHSYDTTKWEKDDKEHWHICTECKAIDTKIAHKFEWVIDTPATVTSTGLKHEECVCGAKQNENTIIDILDCEHKNKDHHEAVAATCVATGNVEYWYCNDCKKNVDSTGNEISNITVAIDPNAHDIEHHEAQAATCVAVGWNAYDECKRCTYTTYSEIAIDPEAHSWGEWVQTKAPTYAEDGEERRECQNAGCAHYETKAVAMLEKEQAVISNFTLADTEYGEEITPAATTSHGSVTFTYSSVLDGEYAVTKPVNAGTYYIKATVAEGESYLGAEKVISFKILKRAITVTINAASSEEGQELEALTATVTAGTLVAGDSNVYALSTTADKDSINSYPITGTCLNDNYNITFVDGVYIVSKRAEDPNGGGAIDMPTDANVEFKVTQSKTTGDYSALNGMSVGYWAQLWNRNADGTLGDEYTDSLNCVLTLKIPTEIIEAIRGGEEINREKIADGLGVYYVTDGGLEKVNAFTIAQREDESWIVKFNYNSKFRAEVVFNAENFEEPAEEPEKSGIPWWVWLIVGIGGATLITIIIVAVVLAKKKSANGGNAPAPAPAPQVKEYDDAELKARLDEQSKRIDELANRDDGGFNDVYRGE